MPSVDAVTFEVETKVSQSARARQVSAMFDVPAQEKCKLSWTVPLPIKEKPWQVGLIVGPSGSGKSTLMKKAFGNPTVLDWVAPSVVDDFSPALGVQEISEACGAVGFNTIPAWLRPFAVLSNGERFRVEMARLLLETQGTVVVDEFTSLVDRQVAKVASHAVQKFVRRQPGKQLVAVTCHYDVEEWLQPDWVVDMADSSFRWRSVQRRPALDCEIRRVPYAEWRVFAPFHYLTADLHRNARCFELYVGGQRTAFTGMIHFPHPKVKDIQQCSRLVTLPDWQGLGLAFALLDRVAAAYGGIGKRVRTYPAHPSFVRAFAKSPQWRMVKAPGLAGRTTRSSGTSTLGDGHNYGERPSAVFEYVGADMPAPEATAFLA